MLIIYRLLKPKFVEFVDGLPGIFLSMEVFFLLLNILFILRLVFHNLCTGCERNKDKFLFILQFSHILYFEHNTTKWHFCRAHKL